MHRVCWLALLCCLGCSGPALDPKAQQNLKDQAQEMGQASLKLDYKKVADLTHPMLIEKLGGTDKYVQKLKDMTADMNRAGAKFTQIRISEPSQLIEAKKEVYAVVPYELEMSGPSGQRRNVVSFFVSVSSDGGKNWKFLDGHGFNGDRSKLKSALPNFPDQLALPPVSEG